MAVDRARFAGEAVAVVLAESRYLAEDAAERVRVDYEPLPAAVDVATARQPGAPLVHPEWGDNLAVYVRVAAGDVDSAFARAACVVRRRFASQRLTGIPLETRGIVARPEADGGLTVWSSTQTPHALRDVIAGQPKLDAARDPRGGAGRGRRLRHQGAGVPRRSAGRLAGARARPARASGSRTARAFLSAIQSRDQVHDIELALPPTARSSACATTSPSTCGAYNPLGLVPAV